MEKLNHADYSNFMDGMSKEDTLDMVALTYSALVDNQPNWVANLSNCASLVFHAYQALSVPVNWAGFYVLDPLASNQLILGPFMGKVACQVIPFGKGVCGTAASTAQTQLVMDVEKFPGHIACDGETKSEIVVPILDAQGVLRGVLDLDCLVLNGFDENDQTRLEALCALIGKTCAWPEITHS